MKKGASGKSIPEHLSVGILNLKREDGQNTSEAHLGVFQILDFRKTEDNKCLMGTLSDGVVKRECIFYKEAFENYKKGIIKEKDVIEGRLYFYKKGIVLTEFEICYDNIKVKIGDPISFIKYLDSNIMLRVWSKNAIPQQIVHKKIVADIHKELLNDKIDFEEQPNPGRRTAMPEDKEQEVSKELKRGKSNTEEDLTVKEENEYMIEEDPRLLRIPEDMKKNGEKHSIKMAFLVRGSNRVYIKVRIVFIGELKNYKEGKYVLKMVVEDDSRRYDLVCFQQTALIINKYFKVGETVVIRDVNLDKERAINFSVSGNKLCINWTPRSRIMKVEDDPTLVFETSGFVDIQDLRSKEQGNLVSIKGIVRSKNDSKTFVDKKTGEDRKMYKLVVFDSSLYQVEITFFQGNKPQSFNSLERGDVVQISDLKINTFMNSISLVHTPMTSFKVLDDKIAIGDKLLSTKNTMNLLLPRIKKLTLSSESNPNIPKFYSSISHVEEESARILFQERDPEEHEDDIPSPTFSIIGTVSNFVGKQFYNSCSSVTCKKGVKQVSPGDGLYYCQACDLNTPTPIPCFLGRVVISDSSGAILCSFFGEYIGMELLDTIAENLAEMDEEERSQYLAQRKNNSYHFTVYSKLNEYNGETKVKYWIKKVIKLEDNWDDVNSKLIETLRMLL